MRVEAMHKDKNAPIAWQMLFEPDLLLPPVTEGRYFEHGKVIRRIGGQEPLHLTDLPPLIWRNGDGNLGQGNSVCALPREENALIL
jgi:hypothetical protein